MLKCKICGKEFIPSIDRHYVAKDNGESGLSTVFKSIEGNLYDTFDCPECGCQVIAQERKRAFTSYAPSGDDNEEDESNE